MHDDTPDPRFAPPSEAPSRAEHAAGTCARCNLYATNGTVHWVPRESGPDARLIVHTDRAECRAA